MLANPPTVLLTVRNAPLCFHISNRDSAKSGIAQYSTTCTVQVLFVECSSMNVLTLRLEVSSFDYSGS